MNFIAFAGEVGDKINSGETNSGVAYLKFTVMTKGKSTTYEPCICWGSNVDAFRQYITAGALVLVTGSTTRRTYEDNQGIKRLSVEAKIDTCTPVVAPAVTYNPEPVADNTQDPFGPTRPIGPDQDDDLPF